jgi:hypothetical protein
MKISKQDISPNPNYWDGKAFAGEGSFENFKDKFNEARDCLESANFSVRDNSKLGKKMIKLMRLIGEIEIE